MQSQPILMMPAEVNWARELDASHLTRRLFGQILGRIERFAGHPIASPPHGARAMGSGVEPAEVLLNGAADEVVNRSGRRRELIADCPLVQPHEMARNEIHPGKSRIEGGTP